MLAGSVAWAQVSDPIWGGTRAIAHNARVTLYCLNGTDPTRPNRLGIYAITRGTVTISRVTSTSATIECKHPSQPD